MKKELAKSLNKNKKVVFLVGNFGVGKSTLISNKVLEVDDLFLRISEGWWVLGTDICGADSVSKFKKSEVMKKVEAARHKGIIIAGNYYCSHVDVRALAKNNAVHIVYLRTSFENNAKRIAQRGGLINPTTYNQKLKAHTNLMRNNQDVAHIHILDNNKGAKSTRSSFEKILNKI